MPRQTLYKYRSLDNWKFVVDIVANSRLYAAPFEQLNDPMEGRYFYFGDGGVPEGLSKVLLQSKRRRNICALSRDKDNTLLWSYYAGGHTGVAFGVRPRGKVEVHEVRYDNAIYIDPASVKGNADALALAILTQKQEYWDHEKESRVFVTESFVPVTLVEVILGCNVREDDEQLLRALVRRWHPKIRVRKLRRAELDKPNAIPVVEHLESRSRVNRSVVRWG